ncbi:uncharacterized protein BDZ99DRAFT_468444 [Mytilinidion resinicola]|uniref:Uncharacterized protein n=1 Tax=Mytilinidion resinicola TaxID=574789 RepID=A0A6A6Y5N6_9PEZI|nr:uncharacterized protein BDZ99DRAFT_468444 [Mytilinidion resinicola]KAF2803097.1 hypothetical protein BDZ99DRAFT_468444 [Mytilinidion resinicola]
MDPGLAQGVIQPTLAPAAEPAAQTLHRDQSFINIDPSLDNWVLQQGLAPHESNFPAVPPGTQPANFDPAIGLQPPTPPATPNVFASAADAFNEIQAGWASPPADADVEWRLKTRTELAANSQDINYSAEPSAEADLDALLDHLLYPTPAVPSSDSMGRDLSDYSCSGHNDMEEEL